MIGKRVFLKTWKKYGKIEDFDEKKKIVKVKLENNMILSEKLKNIEIIEEGEKKTKSEIEIKIDTPFSPSLDLHGYTILEAEEVIEEFINKAFVRKIPKVEIIHGEGSGKLRNAVRIYLENHKFVRRIEFAHPAFGGTGVTIAYLDL